MVTRGMAQPLFVGGAAASAVHTAVKLAPIYSNVHYGPDASATAVMAKKYIQSPADFIAAENQAHAKLAELRSKGLELRAAAPSEAVAGGFLEGRPFTDIPLAELRWDELEPCFDWRMYFGLCGIKGGCDCADCMKATDGFRYKALTYIGRTSPSATVCARFFDCSRENDVIISADGSMKLPMLRDGHSLADFIPASGTAQTGVFAVKVDCPQDNDFIGHAVRVTMAEAASEYLRRKWTASLPEGIRLITPGIGYACCPDHSLKRDVLALLPDIGISLTESCAMIPEASICGLVIAHRDASYRDIRHVGSASLEAYASLRGFSPAERKLFLSHLED